MKLVPFSILTALALLYAALTFSESALYQRWEHAQMEQKNIQARVTYFQRLNGFIEDVLRRLAVDSQHDPALVDLLKQNQIKVVITNPDGSVNGSPTGAPNSSSAAPASSGTPAPADQTTPGTTSSQQ